MAWLINLGGAGLFALAVIDSSVIPISLPGSADLVLLLLTAFRSKSIASPVLFGSCAFAGSVTGGYMTWAAGKKGGEAALERLGKGRLVRRVQGWVKRNGVVSVGIGCSFASTGAFNAVSAGGRSVGAFARAFFVSHTARRSRVAVWNRCVAWVQVRTSCGRALAERSEGLDHPDYERLPRAVFVRSVVRCVEVPERKSQSEVAGS